MKFGKSLNSLSLAQILCLEMSLSMASHKTCVLNSNGIFVNDATDLHSRTAMTLS